MQRRSVLYGSLTIAAVSLFVACGDDPSPTQPSPLTPSEFAGIQVIGPDSLAAGQSVQFVANIRQADGTTKSATSLPNLRWRSSNTSVMWVSDSGMVTAAPSGFGEAVVITADITPQGVVQGTREVVVRRKAVVTGTFEVSQSGTEPDQVFYVFALKLTESAGVPATVTGVWISFDGRWFDGWWGAQCSFAADKLGQKRVPANGTLTLDPLTCDDWHELAFAVDVELDLTDDNGYKTQVNLHRGFTSVRPG